MNWFHVNELDFSRAHSSHLDSLNWTNKLEVDIENGCDGVPALRRVHRGPRWVRALRLLHRLGLLPATSSRWKTPATDTSTPIGRSSVASWATLCRRLKPKRRRKSKVTEWSSMTNGCAVASNTWTTPASSTATRAAGHTVSIQSIVNELIS